jgi:hypothetical protein
MAKTTSAVTAPKAADAKAAKKPVAQTATEPSQMVASVMEIRERIEALAVAREAWETNVYARSNDMLYGLIQKCYELYLDLTKSEGDVGARKVGFNDYINTKGFAFKASTPLTGKIIRCVFGDKDRRRLCTYHTALRVVVQKQWPVAEVPAKIAELGGVQEISLGKAEGHLTPRQKADQVKQRVLGTVRATVSSAKISQQNNVEKVGDQAVAVLTQKSDGSYQLHCIVHGDAVVNAALSAYFSANKAEIGKGKVQQAVKQAVATQDELITDAAAAAAAANASDVKASA